MSSQINNLNSSEFINKEKKNSSYDLICSLNSRINKKIAKTPEIMSAKTNSTNTTFNKQKKYYNLELSYFLKSLTMSKDKINKNYNNNLYRKYLNTKNKYNKYEQIISDLDNLNKKIDDNNKKLEKMKENLKKIKEEKKQKQLDVVNLLSNKESLEEIYKNKIFYLIKKNEIKLNSKKNIQNIDDNNINNNNFINENESFKIEEEKELDIIVDDVKKSDKKKFIEQVINFTEDIFKKRDEEFNNEIKNKINMIYKIFFSEISTTNIKPEFIISNFFLRLSLFISNYSFGNYSELNINKFLRYLLKINSIGIEISQIIKFLNKRYKDLKNEIKEQIINLNKKIGNYIEKKKILEKNIKKLDNSNLDKSSEENINNTLDELYFSNDISNYKYKNNENIFRKKECCNTYRSNRRNNNILNSHIKNRNYLYYFTNCNIINSDNNLNEKKSYDFSRKFNWRKNNTNTSINLNDYKINNITSKERNNNEKNERSKMFEFEITNIGDKDKSEISNFGLNKIKIKKINMAKLSKITINNNDIVYNNIDLRNKKINSKINNKDNNNINENLNDFKNINHYNHNNTINLNNFIINNDINIKNINDITNNNNNDNENNNIDIDNKLKIFNSHKINEKLKLKPINSKIFYYNNKSDNIKIKKNNTCGHNNKDFKKITINNIRFLKSYKNKNKTYNITKNINNDDCNLTDKNNIYLDNDKNIVLNKKSFDIHNNNYFNKNIYLINNINNSQKINKNYMYDINTEKNSSNIIEDKKKARNVKYKIFNEEISNYNKTEEKIDENNINKKDNSNNKNFNKISNFIKNNELLNNINFKNIKFKNFIQNKKISHITNSPKKYLILNNTNKNIVQKNNIFSKNIINNIEQNNIDKFPNERKKLSEENMINNYKLKINDNVNNNINIISKDKINKNNKVKSKKKITVIPNFINLKKIYEKNLLEIDKNKTLKKKNLSFNNNN